MDELTTARSDSLLRNPHGRLLEPAPTRRRLTLVKGSSDALPAPGDDNCFSVLFVAEAFGGGMFEITRMKAEGLAKLGHRVAIAYGVRPETPDEVRAVVAPAVELIPLPWVNRSLGAQLRAQQRLRRLVQQWRPDVVHLMSSSAGLHGALATRGVPTIYTPQAYSFTMLSASPLKRWMYLALESFVAHSVDVVGACSLSEGAQARCLPGARAVAVVPNGISELSNGTARGPSPLDRADVVVGVGRPLPQRQPEACARILSAVSDIAEVRWLGGGDVSSPGVQALTRAGIPVTGWMPRRDTLAALSASRIYLHWTAWDGLPLTVLEALAHDVVVVASDIGCNREVLGPRQVCRSEREAIALIRSLLSEPERYAELLAAQRNTRQLYGADTMVARWIEVYTSLLADRAAASEPMGET